MEEKQIRRYSIGFSEYLREKHNSNNKLLRAICEAEYIIESVKQSVLCRTHSKSEKFETKSKKDETKSKKVETKSKIVETKSKSKSKPNSQPRKSARNQMKEEEKKPKYMLRSVKKEK